MWTRGSSSWAAGPQYSGWSPSDGRDVTTLRSPSSQLDSDSLHSTAGPRAAMNDMRRPNDMNGNFEGRRAASMSFDECSIRSNMFRDQLACPQPRVQLPWTRGNDERVSNFNSSVMLQMAMNQARNAKNAESPSNWGADFEDHDRMERNIRAGNAGWNGFGMSPDSDPVNLSADSQIFIPGTAATMGGNLNASFESPQVGSRRVCTTDESLLCSEFSSALQPVSGIDEVDLSRHQTPVQNAPRRLFPSSANESITADGSQFDARKWAAPGSIASSTLPSFFAPPPGSDTVLPAPAQPVSIMKMGGQVGFCRQVELFGGSGPAYKPDSEERFRPSGVPSGGCASPPQAIPSPMPPKPKVVQFPSLGMGEEVVEDVAGIDRKTCDALLLNTLVYMVTFLNVNVRPRSIIKS